ncbi:hypothetical protein GCM10027416_08070 [Okibacterium endophyticum]
MPNFRDRHLYANHPDFIDPRAKVEAVISAIVQSEVIVASSLHGVILAEAFGIPAIWTKSREESPVKYEDYYLGTGRDDYPPALDFDDAIRLTVGFRPSGTGLSDWNRSSLENAFPLDLWT